ncbi:MAG: Yip1 family protein [Burkholderiaceae bacterium]|nr:Yip1 family protein [Burkholderiaceae bacterium]
MDIVARAKAITLNPAGTWPVIDAEQHDAKSLFVPYMLILAAIPAVSTFIGMSVIGIGGFGFSMRVPILSGLAMMVTTYILSLVMTFGMGWLISALAPTFGGQSNLVQGLKIAVFGATPMMLAGIFNILPALSIISLLVALYSLYIIYLGLPVLMKNPPEKTITYMVIVVIASIIAGVLLGVLSRAFAPSMGGMGRYSGGDATISTPMGDIKIDASKASGMKDLPAQTTISTPAGNATITTTPGAASAPDTAVIAIKTPEGEINIDVKKMEALSKQMEEMAAQMEKNKK